MPSKMHEAVFTAVKQLLNLAGQLGLDIKYYDRQLLSSDKAEEWFRAMTKGTKAKWDDKVWNFVSGVINLWKPWLKKLDKKNRDLYDQLKSAYEENKKSMPTFQEIRADVQARDKKYLEEAKERVRQTAARRKEKWNEIKASIDDQMNTMKDYQQERLDKNLAARKEAADKQNEFMKKVFGDNYRGIDYDAKGGFNMSKRGQNDLSWYTQGNTLSSVTMPQFLVRKGVPGLFGYNSSQSSIQAVPSVCGIQYALTIGSDAQGAYTTSMNRLFSNLRRANTGSIPYTVLDVEHYIWNLRVAITMDRYLRRAYGVLMAYDSLDSQKPISFFKAMGLDYDTFKVNGPNLRYFINNSAVRIHSLVAGYSPLLERTAWLCDHIFCDSDDVKCQYYLFVPTNLKYFDYATQTYKALPINQLTNSNTSTGMGYSTVIYNVTTFLKDILEDPIVSVISADIIKAFGPSQVDKYFNLIDENYYVKPVYNEEVLTEIQNAKFVGFPFNQTLTDSVHMTETVGSAFSAQFIGTNPTGAGIYCTSAPINFYKNNIDLAEYACATRFSFYANLDGSGATTLVHYGTEVAVQLHFVTSTTGSAYLYKLSNEIYDPTELAFLTSTSGIRSVFILASMWSHFDWMPLMVFLANEFNSGNDGNDSSAYELFDYNNYCILNNELDYSNIHTAVVLSLYNWPDVIREQRTLSLAELRQTGDGKENKRNTKDKRKYKHRPIDL